MQDMSLQINSVHYVREQRCYVNFTKKRSTPCTKRYTEVSLSHLEIFAYIDVSVYKHRLFFSINKNSLSVLQDRSHSFNKEKKMSVNVNRDIYVCKNLHV